MPIAKPAAIEKILYHMANVGNKVRRDALTPSGYAKYAEQQRLPLYPESVMKDFDQITGAMSEGKLSNIAENLIDSDRFSKTYRMYGDKEPTAYQGWDNADVAKVAIPEESLIKYGPSVIPHEGRHLEVEQGKYGTPGVQPVFEYSGDNPNVKDWVSVSPDISPSNYENRSIGGLSNFTEFHHKPNLSELDASMSEVGTLMKAGDDTLSTAKFYGDTMPEHAAKKKREYLQFWNLLPQRAKEHYIKTAALAGIAAPSIGAFQPETKNK